MLPKIKHMSHLKIEREIATLPPRSLMCSRKRVGKRLKLWGNSTELWALAKTHNSEPIEAIYYWEKTKKKQIPELKLHKTWVCGEDQHAKPCQKLWIYIK